MVHLLCKKHEIQWENYLKTKDKAHFYYDLRWRAVFEGFFDHKCIYLIHSDQEKVGGVLPLVLMKNLSGSKCLISLPFVNYGGVIANDVEVETELMAKALQLKSEYQAKYLELRQVKPLEGDDIITRTHKVTMVLSLESNLEDQEKLMKSKVRNQLKKASASGLTCVWGKQELLNDFYTVFSRNMRDLGTPVLDKNLFRVLLEIFEKESKICVLRMGNNVVAAAFLLKNNHVLEVPWASSIRAYNSSCPNILMYWEMIKKAIEEKCSRFDFGRCTKDSGTYHFKKQWGALEEQLYWQYAASSTEEIPSTNHNQTHAGLMIKAWKKLPVSIANLIGPRISKNIPQF